MLYYAAICSGKGFGRDTDKERTKMESANNTAAVQDDGLAELQETIARVRTAQRKFAAYSQAEVDAIFKAAALAANSLRIPLAKMAVTVPAFKSRSK